MIAQSRAGATTTCQSLDKSKITNPQTLIKSKIENRKSTPYLPKILPQNPFFF
jgi:hypothetical protein